MANQTIFQHSAIISKVGVQRAWTKILQQVFEAAFTEMGSRIVVRAVEAVGQEIMDAEFSYRNPVSGMFHAPLSASNGEIEELTLRELYERLMFVEVRDDEPDPGAATTVIVLDNIQMMSEEQPELNDTILAERIEDAPDPIPQDPTIQTFPFVVGCAFAEAFDLVSLRRRLSRAAKSFLRRCLNPSSDGKRVSREPHEYSYCVSSGQIQDVFDGLRTAAENNEDLNAIVEDLPVTNELTYGQFVDAQNFRKTIAQIRKVRRLLRSANVLEISRVGNLDLADLETNLIGSLDFTPAATELQAIFNVE